MHQLKYNWSKLDRNAWDNRQELIKAGITTRRDLMKLGLLTSAGYLVAKNGLSTRAAHAQSVVSPPTRDWIQPLPIMPVKQPLAGDLGDGRLLMNPYPTIQPNNAGGEGRTRAHQAFLDPALSAKLGIEIPRKTYQIWQKIAPISVHPDLPIQQMWGFDGQVPGPTYHVRYGEQILVRNTNALPADNGGFGMNRVSTHLHNSHSASESDGNPYDHFPNPRKPEIANAWFYDQHYPNVLAGFASSHPNINPATGLPGDINESVSTQWYHDHMLGYTAQNTYKGLAGFYLLFNKYDTGDETTGFRLPGVRDPGNFYANVQYDIPLMLCDRMFDPSTGALYFDLFNQDGIISDKVLVNGAISPYLETKARRYRFRVLSGGPSRFYQLFLTDGGANTSIPFWIISSDGNLLPKPVKVTSLHLSVAERIDIVVDFKNWSGKTLYLENRLVQSNGRGADSNNIGAPGTLAAPGAGKYILQFRVGAPAVDNSVDFNTNPNWSFYGLPTKTLARVTRNFRFERTNGLWVINGKPLTEDENVVGFRVKRNTSEIFNVTNNSGSWMHPVHIHFEEFQMIRRNGVPIGAGNPEYGRKDVVQLQHNETNTLQWRFRDFTGKYVMHCHNTIHEDAAMMVRWDIDDTGDTNLNP